MPSDSTAGEIWMTLGIESGFGIARWPNLALSPNVGVIEFGGKEDGFVRDGKDSEGPGDVR